MSGQMDLTVARRSISVVTQPSQPMYKLVAQALKYETKRMSLVIHPAAFHPMFAYQNSPQCYQQLHTV